MIPTKILSLFLCFCLILEQSVFAQTIDLSHYFARNPARTIPQSDKFRPLHLRYISYDNQANDFKILLDKGDVVGNGLKPFPTLEDATQELMKYFFIGLALPNEKFWVNLRPDSPDNILDPDLEKTDIGRIFLEADLQLKKDTSGMTSPQTKEGREYWDKLYKKAGELFGTENITIPTITRPWIVPNEIIIREAPDNAYIYKATLKVMLEEDYLIGRGGSRTAPTYQQSAFSDPRLKELNEYSTELIRETIIPKLTYAVNTSKRYAPLRQVYYSLILAQWFKQKYGSVRSASAPGHLPAGKQARALVNSYIDLIDSGNLANLTSKEPYDKQTYFQQYQKLFKDGEYNLQEPVYTPMGQSIRRYTSGGMQMDCSLVMESIPAKGDLVFASSAVEGYGFKEGKVSELRGDLVGKGLHLPPSKLRGSLVDAGKHENSETKQKLTLEEKELIKNILISGKGLDAVKRYGWSKVRKVLTQINYAGVAKKQLEDVVMLEESGFRRVVLPPGTGDKIDAQVGEIYDKYEKLYPRGGSKAKIYFTQNAGKYRLEGRNVLLKPGTYNMRIELALSADNFPKAYDIICRTFIDKSIAQYVSVAFYGGVLGQGKDHELHRPFIIYIPYKEDYDKLLSDICASLSEIKQKNPEIFKLSPEERIHIKRVNTALFKIPLDENIWCYEVNVVPGSIRGLGTYINYYEGYAVQIGSRLFDGIFPPAPIEGSTGQVYMFSGPFAMARSDKPMEEWFEKFLATLSLSPKQIINIGGLTAAERYQHMPALVAVSSAIEANDNDLLTKKHLSASSAVEDIIELFQGNDYVAMLKKYKSLSAETKEEIREKFLQNFPLIQDAVDKILNNPPYEYVLRKDDKMSDLMFAVAELLSRYPGGRIISLGRSPLWFIETAKLIELLKTESVNTDRYGYIAFSGKWYDNKNNSLEKNHYGPNKDQIKAYRKYLSKIGLDPKAIIEKKEKTIIVEYTQTGGSLRSFIDILMDPEWAEELGADLQKVKDKIVIHLLWYPWSGLAEIHLEGFTINYLPVDRELMKDLANSDRFDDSLGIKYNYDEWFKVDPLKAHISLKAALVRFRIIDFLANHKLPAKISERFFASSAIRNEQVGGIAFNALPIQTQTMSITSSPLFLTTSFQPLTTVDLDVEWVRIQAVFNAGVRPSIQRLSEYTVAASASPLAEDKIDQVRVMLADILRRDEESEKLISAEESCKQLLRALEAG